ncbi:MULTISPECIES: universal stress protein [unclassified Janthinobacterium]|uniref:universal stress protein n=1 Tax=unclassified Janthinobacterium TaxID=2610881 RepID=UPI00161D5555|nr:MULTISPECIES: universal stress protein [unclassified Janthinobacterium]MBB5367744.1 nucleotide-binding universal stress UspA family protein [Janthinobacterium sp. K2C7]MBB5379778.1 nucleotide-binding universal stress UspA family protein [Janthinobacterium sp. K2Li3]MBB5386126.1 nucleotide-binding universal stress UspA family protein [Janthinobacterium sp. K2E3]
MQAAPPHPQRQDHANHGVPGQDDAAQKVLLLLVPIKRLEDIIFGARYARRLQEWGICVKVSLLHVTPVHSANSVIGNSSKTEAAAAQLMQEAGLYLSRSHIEFSTFISSGDVAFTILDTAELLGCHEVILPAPKPRHWPRRFSGDLARKLARDSRSAIVLQANQDGVSGPVPV